MFYCTARLRWVSPAWPQAPLLLVCCCWLWALPVEAAGPYGADNGWAVDHSSAAIYLTSSLANQMVQGETGWLRVEMYLVNGHASWDPTVLGYYDTVVNNALNAGLQVLMLVDGGSWPGSQTQWCANNAEHNPGSNGDNPYVEGFATNALLPIVEHFHDRVKVYELWNEPNAWTTNSSGFYSGGTYLYPSNYGWLLARSWATVHQAHGYNDVTLFSGGLFGHDNFGGPTYANAGAQYLDDTYNTGTNASAGGSFNFIKTNYNAYPLDGIGQHLYLTQGGTVSSNEFRQYEDWVHSAMTKYEGTNSPKKTFITEFGWTTASVSQQVQDTNLVTSFSAINATPYVQVAIWFQWADNVAGHMYYGVVSNSGNAKVAFPDYQRFERFEGMYSNGMTNSGIQTYFESKGGAPVFGSPYDNGHGPWVYAWLNGYAQDCSGGSRSKLTLLSSTNGTFELNNLHGLWSYYQTNNGARSFGYVLDNEFASSSGTRQDFEFGYLTWDPVNNVVWHANHPVLSISAGAVLTWSGAYTLQNATNVSGPYGDVTNAASPFTNGTSGQPQGFFRLRQ